MSLSIFSNVFILKTFPFTLEIPISSRVFPIIIVLLCRINGKRVPEKGIAPIEKRFYPLKNGSLLNNRIGFGRLFCTFHLSACLFGTYPYRQVDFEWLAVLKSRFVIILFLQMIKTPINLKPFHSNRISERKNAGYGEKFDKTIQDVNNNP